MSDVETMGLRRVVICLDGTNNEPGDAQTNVQRLHGVIQRVPGQQLLYYQPGVGTLEPLGVVTSLWRKLLMLVDSANGWMMKRHACAAYEYLCDVYRPGDEIYLIGFSRGAQSARIVAGMVATVGILHSGMREMVPFAWKTYTSWAPFTAMTRIGQALGAKRSGRLRRDYFRRAENFKRCFGQATRIRFLGLWDTVSSVGPPWNPKVYNQTDSNHEVDIVRHAISVDERRVSFEPRMWNRASQGQDVREVWFPGVHSDVGGGYAGRAAQTAKISLAWMIRELSTTTSIRMNTVELAKLKLPNLANAKLVGKAALRSRNDELRKLHWRLLEFLPFPRWSLNRRDWHLHLFPHLSRRRTIPAGAVLHNSVMLRMRLQRGYEPKLPADYTITT